MTTEITSSIGLCPINFEGFEKINKITNNLEATLLFSKLKFHQVNSKLKKSGKTWIARSREQISSWFRFSTKKTDRLLAILEDLDLIERKVGLWYGKKRLFISTTLEITHTPVNQRLLEILIEATGSVRAALIFSRIAYSFANTKIENENKKWCCLKKQDLADWAGLSIRTIDGILETLLKKGLVLKKKFIWREKLQTHFHIPDFTVITLKTQFQKAGGVTTKLKDKIGKEGSSQNYRQLPAEKGISIKIRTNLKKTNNNTSEQQKFLSDKARTNGGINFNIQQKKPSQQQLSYLKGALENTVERFSLRISSPTTLWEELVFSVSNAQQHQGVRSFPHAVSRCMKLLSQENWRTPIGFYRHSEAGIRIGAQRAEQEEKWQMQKTLEITKSQHCQLPTMNFNDARTLDAGKTAKALQFAKKIVALTAEHSASPTQPKAAFDYLTDQIQTLIQQGADREAIADVLRPSSC